MGWFVVLYQEGWRCMSVWHVGYGEEHWLAESGAGEEERGPGRCLGRPGIEGRGCCTIF
jgi:hypothetical protein